MIDSMPAHPVPEAPPRMRSEAQRLPWVDNLRTFVILLVVNMHACVTYSHVGDWYIMVSPEPAMAVKIPFLFWQGHLQSFFMGLLFFLAGYFAHGSLARKGAGPFLRERFLRLMVPALVYMLVINPFILFILLRRSPHLPGPADLAARYLDYLLGGQVLRGTGPLWFAVALFVFCLVMAGRRAGPGSSEEEETAPPGVAAILALLATLVITTFLVRTVQPIGTSISNFQLCFFPQYIAAFVVGIHARKHTWLRSVGRTRRARIAGWCGLIGGPLMLAAILVLTGPFDEKRPPFFGGWNWSAFGLAAWEQSAGLCLSLGLLWVFPRFLNRETPLLRWLSANSFAVYVLHAPILIILARWLRAAEGNPFVSALLLTATGLVATFLAAAMLRQIRIVRAVL